MGMSSQYLLKFHPVNACHLLSRRAIPIYRDINYKFFPSLSISLTTKSMSDFRISRFVMIILKKLTCSSSGWYPINMVPALVIPSLIFGATFNVKVGMKRKKLSFDSQCLKHFYIHYVYNISVTSKDLQIHDKYVNYHCSYKMTMLNFV